MSKLSSAVFNFRGVSFNEAAPIRLYENGRFVLTFKNYEDLKQTTDNINYPVVVEGVSFSDNCYQLRIITNE